MVLFKLMLTIEQDTNDDDNLAVILSKTSPGIEVTSGGQPLPLSYIAY